MAARSLLVDLYIFERVAVLIGPSRRFIQRRQTDVTIIESESDLIGDRFAMANTYDFVTDRDTARGIRSILIKKFVDAKLTEPADPTKVREVQAELIRVNERLLVLIEEEKTESEAKDDQSRRGSRRPSQGPTASHAHAPPPKPVRAVAPGGHVVPSFYPVAAPVEASAPDGRTESSCYPVATSVEASAPVSPDDDVITANDAAVDVSAPAGPVEVCIIYGDSAPVEAAAPGAEANANDAAVEASAPVGPVEVFIVDRNTTPVEAAAPGADANAQVASVEAAAPEGDAEVVFNAVISPDEKNQAKVSPPVGRSRRGGIRVSDPPPPAPPPKPPPSKAGPSGSVCASTPSANLISLGPTHCPISRVPRHHHRKGPVRYF